MAILQKHLEIVYQHHRASESDCVTDNLHRVVCDYLAGMTDRYCHDCYEKMTGEING